MVLCKVIIGDAKRMDELGDGTVHLVITSPPYWNLKKYGRGEQIGFSQAYGHYVEDIGSVFRECVRVTMPGRFICINVGTAISDEEMKPIPVDVIRLMDAMGCKLKKEIIWVKPKGTQGLWQRGTTQFLKSPYPGNFNINIMHEYILIFQKLGGQWVPREGQRRLPERFVKDVSWSVWELGVALSKGHPAPFPDEIPSRLIRLFSYEGELVLDPFGGSGTTMKVARDLGRNCVLYEINGEYLSLIKDKVGWGTQSLFEEHEYEVVVRDLGG